MAGCIIFQNMTMRKPSMPKSLDVSVYPSMPMFLAYKNIYKNFKLKSSIPKFSNIHRNVRVRVLEGRRESPFSPLPECIEELPEEDMLTDYGPTSVFIDDPTDSDANLVAAATFAIYHYNHTENRKRYFEFYKLLNASSTPVAGRNYKITFEAKEQGILDRPAVETFQAAVYHRYDNTLQVAYCGLKEEILISPRTGLPYLSNHILSPTKADWGGSHLVWRNHGPYSVASLDVDVKTIATVAMHLQSRYEKGYMFSNLVSAFFTDVDGARIFNITFEAKGFWEENINVVKTFEAVVWQMYPSFNLEVESCRLKNVMRRRRPLDKMLKSQHIRC